MRVETEEFWRQAETGLRSTVPSLGTFVLVLICVLPYGIPNLDKVMPLLPIISIYFWSVHRPDLAFVTGHFVIGLIQDILVGTPMGFSAAMFVGVHAAVHYQRRFFYGKTFIVLWASFSLLMCFVSFLSFVIISVYSLSLVTFPPVILQLVLTIACYPILVRVFQWVSRVALRPV